MVTMDMRNENGIQLVKRQMHTAHLPLCPLSAVNQKQAPTYVKYLSARIPTCRGLGGRRTQYIQLKLHSFGLFTFLEFEFESCKSVNVTESSLLYVGIDFLHSLLGYVSLGSSLFSLCLSVSLHM